MGFHIFRREATYYWRRRTPHALATFWDRPHLFLSLRTTNPMMARRLAAQLDLILEDATMLAENPNTQLSPGQVEAMLRNVVNRRLTKLERIALAAKGAPGFEVDQARSDDKRAFWTYGLLDAQGATAVVRPEDRIRMASDGLSDVDIAAVQDHLAMLRINELVPTKHHILRQMVEGVEGASTSVESADHFDRTQAHEIGYFPILQGEKGERDRWLIARPRYRFFPSPAQRAILPSHSISCVT